MFYRALTSLTKSPHMIAALAPIAPVIKVGKAYGKFFKKLLDPNILGHCSVGLENTPPNNGKLKSKLSLFLSATYRSKDPGRCLDFH